MACILAFTSCATVETTGPLLQPEPPDDLVFGTVSDVKDGDSIDVDLGADIVETRMIGINANERGECYSDESFNYLTERLYDTRVGIEFVASDQFDRALVVVWLEAEMINLTLVSNGLAITQTADDDYPYAALFLAAESIAYESGIGMWSSTACGSGAPLPDIRIDLEESSIDPPGPDGDHLGDEFVVIVNGEEQTIDLSGWTLRDESSRNRLVFPNGTTIIAGERLKVMSGCGEAPSWCSDTPIWNNDGDMAMLLDENGTVVARARY